MFGSDKIAAQIADELEKARAERYADPKNDCPQWQAPCREHKCRFYTQVLGMNPNTGEQMNRWDCALAWLPVLQVETSQQSRQAGASVDKVATEIRMFHQRMVQMNANAAAELGANNGNNKALGFNGDGRDDRRT